jgi:hypothetical protein
MKTSLLSGFFFSAEKSVSSGEAKRHVTNQVNLLPSPSVRSSIPVVILIPLLVLGTSMSKEVEEFCLNVVMLSFNLPRDLKLEQTMSFFFLNTFIIVYVSDT